MTLWIDWVLLAVPQIASGLAWTSLHSSWLPEGKVETAYSLKACVSRSKQFTGSLRFKGTELLLPWAHLPGMEGRRYLFLSGPHILRLKSSFPLILLHSLGVHSSWISLIFYLACLTSEVWLPFSGSDNRWYVRFGFLKSDWLGLYVNIF